MWTLIVREFVLPHIKSLSVFNAVIAAHSGGEYIMNKVLKWVSVVWQMIFAFKQTIHTNILSTVVEGTNCCSSMSGTITRQWRPVHPILRRTRWHQSIVSQRGPSWSPQTRHQHDTISRQHIVMVPPPLAKKTLHLYMSGFIHHTEIDR